MKMFEVIYKEKGWKKFAGFNRKCTLNTPYVLFKSKNITDPAIRAAKWHKVRPIAPATKHPLKKLLGMAGRAWYFIAKHAPDDNLIVHPRTLLHPRMHFPNDFYGDSVICTVKTPSV